MTTTNSKPLQLVPAGVQHIAGLDASTKRIGYASPRGMTHSIVAAKMPEHPRPMDLARRCSQLRAGLARAITLDPPVPDVVLYERAFTRFAGSSARLDELRGVLRVLLFDMGIAFIDIDNQHLKMFASGKNTADKALMRHMADRAIEADGLTIRAPRNDDETDAWWLRRMGRVGCSLESTTTGFQIDVLHDCGVQWASI